MIFREIALLIDSSVLTKFKVIFLELLKIFLVRDFRIRVEEVSGI